MEDTTGQLSNVWSYLVYLLVHPTFNLTAALILYGIIAIVLLLILVSSIMFLTRRPEDAAPIEEQESDGLSEFAELGAGERFEGIEDRPAPVKGSRAPRQRESKPKRPPMSARTRRVLALSALLVFLGAWGIAGYTTSESGVCTSCHWPAAQHATAAKGMDAHAGADCVSCHETGGNFGRYVTGVPSRIVHFIESQDSAPVHEYGQVTSSACSACHREALSGVTSSTARGLMMSHREPLASGATCTDCHTLRAGVVGTHNQGMGPCLRCHDSKTVSNECSMCHDEKAASAARARTTAFTDVQIPNVKCGGCHDEAKSCDPCHGLRMPHTKDFMATGHARAGAVDFWFNGGDGCAKCHTRTRRSCQSCHSSLLGHAHGTGNGLAGAHKQADVMSCDGCHQQYAFISSRDFCKDLCHTSAAKAASPR